MQSDPDDIRLTICGVCANIRSGQNDEHRDAFCIRDRMRWNHHHAEDESERAATIQDSFCATDSHFGGCGLFCNDAWPWLDELAAAGGVACGWVDNLFWLQPVTKLAEFVEGRG